MRNKKAASKSTGDKAVSNRGKRDTDREKEGGRAGGANDNRAIHPLPCLSSPVHLFFFFPLIFQPPQLNLLSSQSPFPSFPLCPVSTFTSNSKNQSNQHLTKQQQQQQQ